MKVLFIHNRYQYFGGEDAVLSSEIEMLRSNNVFVETVIFNNSTIDNSFEKFVAFFSSIYSIKASKVVRAAIIAHKPDVIHVHNFFPLVSPSVYDVAEKFKIPIVQTLHNYRIACPGAFFLRDGKVCEKCIGGNFMHSIVHKCYKNSYIGSLSLASMDYVHKMIGTWNKKIDRIICLTNFAKNKFVQFGLNESIITVKPNFVESRGVSVSLKPRDNVGLFVGRISHEKGIQNLMKIHDRIKGKILIAGDGPLLERLNGFKNFIVLGRKTPDEIFKLMKQTSFLLFPSIWYEGFPMTIVESFVNRLPVVASKLGAMEEVIVDSKTGLHFEPNNLAEMVEKINWAFENYDKMRQYGENAYSEYLRYYTAEENYKILISIYNEEILKYEQRS